MKRLVGAIAASFCICLNLASCGGTQTRNDPAGSPAGTLLAAGPPLVAGTRNCEFVDSGWGPAGSVQLHVDKVVTGLKIPWGIAFLPNGDWLITERPGRIRLVQGGVLASQPVAQITTGEKSEGGLLGIALHPSFASNGLFYVFYSTPSNTNRVERFKLSPDHRSAVSDRVIIDGIPSGTFHDSGRIRFGPDGDLYIATGDAQTPDLAQDRTSLNGKLLRVDADGGIPADNPFPGSAVWALGIRNLEAFDWSDANTVILADNGPTGELGLTGLDKVTFAQAGSNLGWPTTHGCEAKPGLITPILSWRLAAPPGGAIVYRGDAIPEFKGSFIIGMLGMGQSPAHHLHRVAFDPVAHTLVSHEVYLQDGYGRLRDVEQGPDGALYVTTSNCDTRGTCPADGDYVLRITRGR